MFMHSESSTKFEAVAEMSKSQKITIKSDYLKTPQLLHALAIALIPFIGTIIAIAIALQSGIGPVEIGLLIGMYILTMIGITVGFHRHFTHRAFQTGTVIRVMLAILGSMACQGPLIYWVSNHRRHHRYGDQPEDPHSPYLKGGKPLGRLAGLWHSHMGWTIDHEITNTALFAKDLLQDSAILKVNRLYYVWVLLSLVISTMLGGILTGTWRGALSGFLWGGMVRLFLAYHFTNSINSITHSFGSRSYDTRDHSTNNFWFALPTLGEAWHNNHHAFPNMAIFGMKWWQIDLGGWLIRALKSLGLIWNVNTPAARRIEAQSPPETEF